MKSPISVALRNYAPCMDPNVVIHDRRVVDEAATRIDHLETQIRHFIYALDRGYLACKDDSAFIDALRDAVK